VVDNRIRVGNTGVTLLIIARYHADDTPIRY
jgi:hypothetical protein